MSAFREPMLASPMPEEFDLRPNEWCVEEKFDGHRLVVAVGGRGTQDDLFTTGHSVRAWSRDGKARILPSHIKDALSRFPEGIYDGELFVPGKRCYGVTVHENAAALVYTIFDILELANQDTTSLPYDTRRSLLGKLFEELEDRGLRQNGVALANVMEVHHMDTIHRLRDAVWAADGEGLILKRRNATYRVGKRSKDWLKIKKCQSATLTVTGYVAAKMGPYSKVALVDENGNRVEVKTRNTVERERLAASPDYFLGKKLRIDFQERTPDGSYREPRWDRWEDE